MSVLGPPLGPKFLERRISMRSKNSNVLTPSGSGSNTAITSTLLVRTSSLDFSKHNSNRLDDSDAEPDLEGTEAPCGAARYILSGEKDEDGLHRHFKTFCKSYKCEFCGKRKLALVRAGFVLAIKKYGLDVFVTLTLDPKRCTSSPQESGKYIRNAWNKFRILQKRAFNRNLQFIAVVEFQKSGYAHLHVLFDGFLKHSWIKRTWIAVGGGEIVDVRRSDEYTAKYLAKYLGKEMANQSGRARRAFSTSQGISISRLLKEQGGAPKTKFRFCRASEEEARSILGPYIRENILDLNNRILGFKADRQLNPEPREKV